jgi:uncharacterized membrane protein YbaN (DUF454 family)
MRIDTMSISLRRALLAALGVVSAGLGLIGVFVPGMPTTVFVIVASYLFARSSPRLDGRLKANRWLGPPLRRFAETGGMTPVSKVLALVSMWAGVAVSLIALAGESAVARIVVLSLGLAGTATILFYVRTTPGGFGPASRPV